MHCALCNEPIGESLSSAEHLILQALGGRRKVRGVLCTTCNNTSGAEWDSELARQLNPLALLFGIERQAGEVPAQKFETAGGAQFWLKPDGSLSPAAAPYRKHAKEGGGREIQISARSIRDAKRILKGVKQAHPEVVYEKALASAELKTEYLDEALQMPLGIGGALAGRSLVKSTLCMAVANGVDAEQCTNAQTYLNDDKAEPCFGFYYARDLVRDRLRQVPLHCVAISNRGSDGQLLGYVEFFGFHRMVICLSDQFQGSDVNSSYAINPMTGEELTLNVDLALTRSEVAACFAYELIPDGSYEAVLGELIPVAQKRSLELERDRAVLRAFRNAMKMCGVPEGGELPPEKLSEFCGLVADQMMPFVTRHRNRRRGC